MQVLIIGGGVFLGAAALDAACARGHRVSVFNRGRARREWPAGVEAIEGDRVADLGRLDGRRWDAVIDTCGYVPADVAASAQALRHSCGRYLFVSSISAYSDTNADTSADTSAGNSADNRTETTAPVADETQPLASAAGIARDDRDPRHYGAQKAACEAEVERAFGARALIVRPGLIVGPGDPTGRFSHWVWRSAGGGAMLVPDVPDAPDLLRNHPLQFIDVRDLAAWLVVLLEAGESGAFDASGPVGGAAIGWPALLDACRAEAIAAGHAPAEAERVGEAFLLQQGVQPWSELPLWLPSIDPAFDGFCRDLGRATAAGLTTRALRETVQAVLAEGLPPEGDRRRAGKLSRAREAELLAAWSTHPQRSPGP